MFLCSICSNTSQDLGLTYAMCCGRFSIRFHPEGASFGEHFQPEAEGIVLFPRLQSHILIFFFKKILLFFPQELLTYQTRSDPAFIQDMRQDHVSNNHAHL